ncbi:MAG: ribosome-associated translation inhibitor RaiA [Chitinophagales bacterium]|nr:ribosome-associated translation inhibitor RaiA [Chitinophagales bacterium]
MQVNIHASEFHVDQKLNDLIEKKIQKLTQYYNKITTAEIYLNLENKSSHVKDKAVGIKLIVPGNTLYADEKSKNFEEAIDMSVDSLRRQLKRYKQKLEQQ